VDDLLSGSEQCGLCRSAVIDWIAVTAHHPHRGPDELPQRALTRLLGKFLIFYVMF